MVNKYRSCRKTNMNLVTISERVVHRRWRGGRLCRNGIYGAVSSRDRSAPQEHRVLAERHQSGRLGTLHEYERNVRVYVCVIIENNQ